MDKLISGVAKTALKIIPGENGDVLHALKSSDPTFAGFGEAYFSSVEKNCVKGWKCHTRMTLNLIVPVGGIRFVIYDDRAGSETFGTFNEFSLGREFEYARLTVSPNLWMAFQGLGENLNLLLNLASIEHDPAEAKSLPVVNDYIPEFKW